MFKKMVKEVTRNRRHVRLRKTVKGTPERPRLSVYRSLKHLHLQAIDDTTGTTLLGLTTLDTEVKGKAKKMSSVEGAKLAGKVFAKRALDKKITQVVFDRGGLQYHGKIKALAESLREAGLKF